MEMTESILGVITGAVGALVTLALGTFVLIKWWRLSSKQTKLLEKEHDGREKVERTFNEIFFTLKAREEHTPKTTIDQLNPVTLSKLVHPASNSDDTT